MTEGNAGLAESPVHNRTFDVRHRAGEPTPLTMR
jgi:hypothetical protein